MRAGKYAEAESILREALAIREKKLPDSWLRFNSMSNLGGSMLGQKKFAEAELLLVKGFEGLKSYERDIPDTAQSRLTEALDRLVLLYDAWGKPQSAADWRAKQRASKRIEKPKKN